MMTAQETICTMALTQVPHLNQLNAKLLYEKVGSASAVFENRHAIRDIIPDASDSLVAALRDVDAALRRAEEEMEFLTRKHIQALCLGDADYPSRLSHCPDAPLVLYYLGNTPLNQRHVINIIGTRKATDYGRDIVRQFVADLKRMRPDILVVSGLAYGIDVCAHREALSNGLATVGVLAHGLDRIYPAMHRQTAAAMVKQGGLLTEYMNQTAMNRGNFVSRNRIVAGISDATIVVESALRGGALITAELAQTYNREVFAFPGRITDASSAGCNRLIYNQQAICIQSAEDLLQCMGWESADAPKPEAAQQELFPDDVAKLSAEEQQIVKALRNCDCKTINQISIDTNIPIHIVTSALSELEWQGLVLSSGGARYRLKRIE